MNHHSPIAAEGLPCIAVPAVFAVIALAFGWCVSAVILCLLTLFVVWFFRNPERKIPENPKFIISPADGKVLRIDDVADHELLEGSLKKISIFMSVFNVHVNRMPCDGVIENVHYHEGRFISANLELVRVAGTILYIEDVDMVDGTPLLDIKPYVPLFDTATDVRTGWFTDRADGVIDARSDGRFRT
ncbi:MAG: TrmO family methyltransferase domain-containing protein [Syntrophales bacterium]